MSVAASWQCQRVLGSIHGVATGSRRKYLFARITAEIGWLGLVSSVAGDC